MVEVESCKIPKWNRSHKWTASQLLAQLMNFRPLPQLLDSWPARTDPWCYEAWSCPRPTWDSLWKWGHRIVAKEDKLGRKEPWVESSRPNSSSWNSERGGCRSLLAGSSWQRCFDMTLLGHASIATSWPLVGAVRYCLAAVCCWIWMSNDVHRFPCPTCWLMS